MSIKTLFIGTLSKIESLDSIIEDNKKKLLPKDQYKGTNKE